VPSLKLNGIVDPTDPDTPFLKQCEYLGISRKGQGTSRSHWVGGRGSAKTTTGILLALRAVTEWMPGLPGCWTEPTYRLCHDVFLAEWRRIVPSDFYKLNKADMTIHCATGSTIYIRSRNVDNSNREVIKGVNLAWGIDDEQAYKHDEQKYMDIDAAIRVNTPYRFHDTLTTPKLGPYKDLVESQGHNLVHATSYDNPHLPQDWAKDMAAQMGPEYMEQEILGRWVALSGRIWKHWSNKPWPEGNIHHHEHAYEEPYFLFFDIGVASSAWLIVQAVEPIDKHGRRLWGVDPVWVVTAEYMPKRDGSVDAILRQIKEEYGTPIRVVAGADLTTRSSTDARTANWYVTRHFGQIPVTPVTGWLADKEVQQSQLSYGILDTKGRRRICASKNLRQHHPETKRGILEMMEQDTWADSEKKKSSVALPKEGRLEHVRDALMYGTVAAMIKPRFGLYAAQAA
jgi:hypothetical protein